MTEERPFDSIALCLSGGGYRAAAFHLGTLSYLNKIEYNNKSLIDSISIISTVSGGTFTGMFYALSITQKKSFEDFYLTLYEFMNKKDLIAESLSLLNQKEAWDGYKQRNLINAFAILYQNELFKGEKFGVFKNIRSSSLHTVIFNSTEFNHGLPFRFQNTGILGNNYINIPDKQLSEQCWEELRLGDILAASSCFPGGFEPILFPHDFIEEKSSLLKNIRDLYFEKGVGLMDGGIVDNQGVQSAMLAGNRGGKSVSLMIISDVSSPFMDPYEGIITDTSQKNVTTFFNSVASIANILNRSLILTFVIGVLFLILGIRKSDTIHAVLLFVSGAFIGIPVAFLVAKTILTNRLRIIIKQLINLIPLHYKPYIPAIKKISIDLLFPMILNRYRSVITMVSEVFMKQIRRLIYYKIYREKDWEFKRISNFIYEFVQKNPGSKNNDLKENAFKGSSQISISEKITQTANVAYNMGTTLWFTEEDRKAEVLDHLIACGQFTICYNLLDYIKKLQNNERSPYSTFQPEEKEKFELLYEQLKKDWEKFSIDPFYGIKEFLGQKLEG